MIGPVAFLSMARRAKRYAADHGYVGAVGPPLGRIVRAAEQGYDGGAHRGRQMGWTGIGSDEQISPLQQGRQPLQRETAGPIFHMREAESIAVSLTADKHDSGIELDDQSPDEFFPMRGGPPLGLRSGADMDDDQRRSISGIYR